MQRWIPALMSLLLLPSLAMAANSQLLATTPSITLVPGQTTAAGYVTLRNNGDQEVVLERIDSDACRAVEMHEMQMQGDMMRMRRLPRVPVPAHGEAAFVPGGDHLMFVGIHASSTAQKAVQATLHFSDGSALPVTFPMQPWGAHD